MIGELILGVVQGMAEWLPVSSEGVLTIVSASFLGNPFLYSVQLSLFLHLGTMLAVLFFYRKDFRDIIQKPLSPLGKFLIISTVFSGATGLIFYSLLGFVSDSLGRYSMILISASLLISAYLQKKWKVKKHYEGKHVKPRHAALVGALQGMAVIPGISRSGVTYSALLLFNYDTVSSLKLSFIMSVPAVLMANVFLQLQGFSVTSGMLAGGVVSFIIGVVSIKFLTELVKKVEFWKVCVALAGLNLLAVVI